MKVQFRHFKATFKSWDTLLQEAADFASTLGPDRLISISHSHNDSSGVVTVWYWSDY